MTEERIDGDEKDVHNAELAADGNDTTVVPASIAPHDAPKYRPRSIALLRDTVKTLCEFIWDKRVPPGKHIWSIPVDVERDFDCILSDAIDEIEVLRKRVDELIVSRASVVETEDHSAQRSERLDSERSAQDKTFKLPDPPAPSGEQENALSAAGLTIPDSARPYRQAARVGIRVECGVCHRMKKPVGRAAALEAANGYCDDDCVGYRQQPLAGSLWPGEHSDDFGYPVSEDGSIEAPEKLPDMAGTEPRLSNEVELPHDASPPISEEEAAAILSQLLDETEMLLEQEKCSEDWLRVQALRLAIQRLQVGSASVSANSGIAGPMSPAQDSSSSTCSAVEQQKEQTK